MLLLLIDRISIRVDELKLSCRSLNDGCSRVVEAYFSIETKQNHEV